METRNLGPERIWIRDSGMYADDGDFDPEFTDETDGVEYTRVNQWVSAETARPDDPEQLVLVCVEGVEGVHFGHNRRSRGMSAEGFWGDYKVTHWMPLPALPSAPGEGDE